MKALSIRQPWAWLIVYAGKDIENRSWFSNFTGTFFVHASKSMTRREYDECRLFVARIKPEIVIPPFHNFMHGGIIGEAHMADCVRTYPSDWFAGPWGFVLYGAKELDFIPMTGALGFFDVPDL
jgi:hypothetical protein